MSGLLGKVYNPIRDKAKPDYLPMLLNVAVLCSSYLWQSSFVSVDT